MHFVATMGSGNDCTYAYRDNLKTTIQKHSLTYQISIGQPSNDKLSYRLWKNVYKYVYRDSLQQPDNYQLWYV